MGEFFKGWQRKIIWLLTKPDRISPKASLTWCLILIPFGLIAYDNTHEGRLVSAGLLSGSFAMFLLFVWDLGRHRLFARWNSKEPPEST